MTNFNSYRSVILIVLLTLFGVTAAPHAVASTIPNLGQAGDFAVFGLQGGNVIINSATSISGNVGYGKNVTSTTNQKVNSFTGTAYVHSTTIFGFTAATYQPTGGIVYGHSGDAIDQLIQNANADAIAASSQFASLSLTHTESEIGGPLNDRSASITSKGLLNVISLSSVNLNTDVLTLRGSASDYFIFNVAGNFDWSNSTTVLDGITADHVLFNFINASDILINKAGTQFKGTILAPLGSVIYHNPASFDGAIIAKNINLHSDFNMSQNTFSSPPAIPEPGTLACLAVGIAGMLASRFKRIRHAA